MPTSSDTSSNSSGGSSAALVAARAAAVMTAAVGAAPHSDPDDGGDEAGEGHRRASAAPRGNDGCGRSGGRGGLALDVGDGAGSGGECRSWTPVTLAPVFLGRWGGTKLCHHWAKKFARPQQMMS